MSTSLPEKVCRDCSATIIHQPIQALDGGVAVVWAKSDGEWICPVTEEEHEPGDPLAVGDAITLGILAMNTLAAPDATSAEHMDDLEENADRAIYMLTQMRDWLDAQGEDFEQSFQQHYLDH